MELVADVLAWFADPANWEGSNGILHRTQEHVRISALSVGIAALAGLPPAIWIFRNAHRWCWPPQALWASASYVCLPEPVQMCESVRAAPIAPPMSVVRLSKGLRMRDWNPAPRPMPTSWQRP